MSRDVVGIEHFFLVKDLEPLVYVTTLVSAGIFLYGVYKKARLWFSSSERPGVNDLSNALLDLFKYTLGQRRLVEHRLPGTAHALIFWGTLVLLVGTILRGIEFELTLRLLGQRFLVGATYLVFKLFMNIGGVALIAGVLLSYYRRLRGVTPNLATSLADHYLLGSLLFLALTGFFLDAVNTMGYRLEYIGLFDPVGTLLANLMVSYGLEHDSLANAYRAVWMAHMLVAILSVGSLPYTKFFHIVTAGLLNVSLTDTRRAPAFRPVLDIEERVEEGFIGAAAVKDLPWKSRLDLDSCTECARCHNVCPATESGKPLSPMLLVLGLRDKMRGGVDSPVVGEWPIDKESYWSCVTCGACVRECPAMIHHVNIILDVRRGLVSKGEEVPSELLEAAYNIMRLGNPFGADPEERRRWLESLSEELGAPLAKPGEEYEYLYWVGCHTSTNPELKHIARLVIKALKKAGVRVALLPEEACCGEPARRLGDEYLFYEVMRSNERAFSKYRFRKILVSCPHGYNVFKHEYPAYGLSVNVEHHSQVLNRLVEEGRLEVVDLGGERVTYHDPCYLARWNSITEDPRGVIKRTKAEFVELGRSRDKTFCCGAGGGHYFFDIKIGERVSKIRSREVVETGAGRLVVACPFCNSMLRAELEHRGVKVTDLSELIKLG